MAFASGTGPSLEGRRISDIIPSNPYLYSYSTVMHRVSQSPVISRYAYFGFGVWRPGWYSYNVWMFRVYGIGLRGLRA